jgi:hypothetical protein
MRKDYFWVRIKRKLLGNVWLSRIVIILSTSFVIGLIGYFLVKNINFEPLIYYSGLVGQFCFLKNNRGAENRINVSFR